MQHVSYRGRLACVKHEVLTAAEPEISSMLPASTAFLKAIISVCRHAGS